MFKLIDKKIITILHIYFWLYWPYAYHNLSYSYIPVATNTNLRAVTFVCPYSGLSINSNDVTYSPELKHRSAHDFIKFEWWKKEEAIFETEEFLFKIHRSWL